MADKAIGELPSAASVNDDSLLAVEQQGKAMKMTGKQFRSFAEASSKVYVDSAIQAAADAQKSKGDAIAAANKRNADVLIIDTAGRLHNKSNLMDELAKINRIISRELPGAARETLLVLDSTTGQNAVNQAKEFKEVAEITGIILTKLDGTAKGGVVLSIKNDLKVPVKFIGVGEGIDDLRPFNPQAFAEGLFEEDKD